MQENPLCLFFTGKEPSHLFPTTKRSKLFLLISKKFVWQEDKKIKRGCQKQVLILNELSVLIAKCQKREQKKSEQTRRYDKM